MKWGAYYETASGILLKEKVEMCSSEKECVCSMMCAIALFVPINLQLKPVDSLIG